jgi:hypothetical protein
MGSRPEDREGHPVPAANLRQTMPTLVRNRPPLEISLLRSSIDAQIDRRHSCVHCHRTPLVGERIYVYGSTAGERVVCELCRPRRREAPARSELVHSPEHERCVRVRRR